MFSMLQSVEEAGWAHMLVAVMSHTLSQGTKVSQLQLSVLILGTPKSISKS